MKYDLEDRTKQFAIRVRLFAKKMPKNMLNVDDIKQVIRSSGSVGANYIEANESLSKKDFLMRAKIYRKEAKESAYWFDLITPDDQQLQNEKLLLRSESEQLTKIFHSIIRKTERGISNSL